MFYRDDVVSYEIEFLQAAGYNKLLTVSGCLGENSTSALMLFPHKMYVSLFFSGLLFDSCFCRILSIVKYCYTSTGSSLTGLFGPFFSLGLFDRYRRFPCLFIGLDLHTHILSRLATLSFFLVLL
jgi:hypothetical protein